MKAEIKINIHKSLLEKAEAYAEAEGQSLSDIVARYLKALCEYEPPKMEDMHPDILAMLETFVEIDEDKSYKELRDEAMIEKHLTE